MRYVMKPGRGDRWHEAARCSPSRLAARYEIHRLHLRPYSELGRLEGVLLGHGVVRTLQTVEHELTEERVPDLALDLEVGLFRPVGEVYVRGYVGSAESN